MKNEQSWFSLIRLSALLVFVFTLFGCAPSTSYVMIASSSDFLQAEQVEAQRIRESIPPDLKKRLKVALAKSQAQAANAALNKQYLAQMPHPQSLLERELLKTVLEWAKEKTPEDRLVLQHRRSTFEGIVNESNDPEVRAKKSWREHPKVQYGAGVVAGAAIGTVPLGPYAADVAIELHALPGGTYQAHVGKACGEVISGVIQMALGCSGMTGGAAMTGTGGGAPAGVVVISASFALAANGYATTVHGLQEAHRLWKEGPPPDAPSAAPQEQLLTPKTAPKQPASTAPPAQAAPAKPAPQAAPAKPATPTQTVTRNRKTGEIVKAPERAKPPGKPASPATSPAGKPPAGDVAKPVAKPRGGDSPAAARGRQVHEEFKQKVKAKKEQNPGWRENPKIYDKDGKELRPDALTPSDRPLELKPNTPSGRAAGKRQLKKYEAATGKKGRVLYYDP